MMAASALHPQRLQPPPSADEVPPAYKHPSKARGAIMLTVMPSAPPCFEWGQWREYVTEAAQSNETGAQGPLIWHKGEAMFNRGWSFCIDCRPQFAVQMDREGRCNPDFHRKPKGGL